MKLDARGLVTPFAGRGCAAAKPAALWQWRSIRSSGRCYIILSTVSPFSLDFALACLVRESCR